MLSGRPSNPFIPLPGENTLFVTPSRTSVVLRGVRSTNCEADPYKLICSNGKAFVTTRRIIFLPTGSSNQFESFTAELSRIVDSYVKTPWIGPNTWVANLERSRSFQCDIWNIPKRIAALRLDINFNEGGAYEFHNTVIKAKERLHQAMEVRNMSLNENGAAGFAVMNPNSDNLEQLPEYGNSLNTVSRDNGEMMCMAARHNSLVDEMGEQPERRSVQPETPQEAQVESPPSYEEAQQSGNYDGHGR